MTSDSGVASIARIMSSGVAYHGKDNRGWHVFDVPRRMSSQTEGPTLFDVKIGGKLLQLVQQSEPMRVYANPKNGDADEWEIPLGSDVRMLIASPTKPEVSEVPAGFMTA
jgi:hypothetical protein